MYLCVIFTATIIQAQYRGHHDRQNFLKLKSAGVYRHDICQHINCHMSLYNYYHCAFDALIPLKACFRIANRKDSFLGNGLSGITLENVVYVRFSRVSICTYNAGTPVKTGDFCCSTTVYHPHSIVDSNQHIWIRKIWTTPPPPKKKKYWAFEL